MSDRELVNDGIPIRTKVWAREGAYDAIDAGIRFAVRVLHARGFETCQSCEGGEGHAYPEPTVDMISGPSDAAGFGALDVLASFGLPVSTVGQVWSVDGLGRPYGEVWRITFFRPFPERADEELMFLWGYQAQRLSRDRDER